MCRVEWPKRRAGGRRARATVRVVLFVNSSSDQGVPYLVSMLGARATLSSSAAPSLCTTAAR